MKKLIDELIIARDNADSIKEAQAVQLCINIVRAHNPWHEVTELPPEHEKVLVQYGDDSVLMGIMDSENKWSVFWSDGLKNEDPDRPVVKWAYLPEANK